MSAQEKNGAEASAKSSAKDPTNPSQKSARAKEKLKAFHEETDIGQTYDLALAGRLLPFVNPHIWLIVFSLLLQLVVMAGALWRPLLMGRIVGDAEASRTDSLLWDGILLSGVVIFQQLLGFFGQYAMQVAGARIMADLRNHIFLFFQKLRLSYFDRTPVGRLVTRATNDVDAVGELFASGVLMAIIDLLSLIGIVVLMLRLNVRLSFVAFAALPLVGLVVNWTRKRSRLAYRDIRTRTARLNSFLNEQVSGIAVVQAYARERKMAEDFDEINDAYRDANKRSIFYEAILDAAIEMVSSLCIASILWWGGISKIGEGVTFALVVTFTQYIKQFFEPVSLLAQRYTILQSAMAGAERIFQLLDMTELETVKTPGQTHEHGPDTEAIRLDHVQFAYKPGVPVLRDVSFDIPRGEKVALVGATGAGKTTISALLLQLYEHQEGQIRVLGKDVRDYDRRELRELFSVVPQDVFLFTGTVLSNIAMSDPEPSLERAKLALSRIGALALFEGRAEGLLAPVDERGANFSAGERQLIAFARAVYKDTPIVILDEATASIDSDTEARLQTALEAMMEGRTAIVIAHRLSTIRTVDRIIVFHKGRVVESGPHAALMEKDGVYAKLYRLQFAKEKLQAKAIEPSTARTPAPPTA
jgi:ATP-binding cassette subfamily B protein